MSDTVSLAQQAWRIYRQFEDEPFVVRPSIPILFFGDSERYHRSPIKVVTVGLNPSKSEFPDADRFFRFRPAEGLNSVSSPAEFNARYLEALNTYFDTQPYRGWFASFEWLLHGLACSYYASSEYANIALHTDLCSPLATDPTWSNLDPAYRARLEPTANALWHELMEHLAPDIIIISVARRYLGKLQFESNGDLTIICTLSSRQNGSPLAKPFEVSLTRMRLHNGKLTHVVFGQAAQTPFGTVSHTNKARIGAAIKKYIYGA